MTYPATVFPMTRGRPSLPQEEAERVVAAMNELLALDRFSGNKTKLAEAIGIKQPSLSLILNGRNRPSMETAEAVAALKGVHVYELLGRPLPPSAPERWVDPDDRYPSRAAAIAAARYLRADEEVLEDVAQEALKFEGDPGFAYWAQQIEARSKAAGRPLAGPTRERPPAERVGAFARRPKKEPKKEEE